MTEGFKKLEKDQQETHISILIFSYYGEIAFSKINKWQQKRAIILMCCC